MGGFGPADRDGSFAGERDEGAYRTWADELAARGLAVLRYDKRGIGESEGPALSWLDARPLAADAGGRRAGAGRPPGRRPAPGEPDRAQPGRRPRLRRRGRRAGGARSSRIGAPGRPLGLLDRASGAAGRFLRRLVGAGASAATLRRDPLPDAARARQPALLVHGTRDRTVPLADMAAIARARDRAGRPTRTLRVPGAGHFARSTAASPPGRSTRSPGSRLPR